MTGLAFTLPAKRVSAWIVETDPKYAREWLASLPLADSAATAREIYQALYTLNRQDLDSTRRFELMELYTAPVATVTASLENYFTHAAFPLSPKKRQLAEFILQLHTEMAYGYKGCLQDLEHLRLRWGKKPQRAISLLRAMHYLGEVLFHCYRVYMPFLPNTWREIHAIYRHAVEQQLATEVVDVSAPRDGKTTLVDEYIRILLLGLCNPYQLPQNECRQAQLFLRHWGTKAILREDLDVPHQPGHFLVDLTTDSPPVPFPTKVQFQPGPSLRLLDASDLLQTIRFFIQRLQQGDSTRALSLGVDTLDMVCLEMLQRMLRSWGQVPRRQFSRIQRSGPVFVCTGIGALHFFSSGQKPFTPPVMESITENTDDKFILPPKIEDEIELEFDADEDFIVLDKPVAQPGPTPESDRMEEAASITSNLYRVERWQIKDAAPKGLQLIRQGGGRAYVRVGDVAGVQQIDEIGRWNAGVVRWMKTPEIDCVEMGIELLASGVRPVAVAHARNTSGDQYQPALLLPAIEALRRPASLLLPRGIYSTGSNLLLVEEEKNSRKVRLLQRLEYTNVFELMVFADILSEV